MLARIFCSLFTSRARAEGPCPAGASEASCGARVRGSPQGTCHVALSLCPRPRTKIAEMQRRGPDLAPHRKRMVTEDLEAEFKDPSDPLRIVFVCAIRTTGSDVPSCSTIYLDKPMKNHTLMQTIARATRRSPRRTTASSSTTSGCSGTSKPPPPSTPDRPRAESSPSRTRRSCSRGCRPPSTTRSTSARAWGRHRLDARSDGLRPDRQGPSRCGAGHRGRRRLAGH